MADESGQSAAERTAIAAFGRRLGPDVLAGVHTLYAAEQWAWSDGQPVAAADLAYGSHPRQRLDLYAPMDADAAAPVLLWVHGGGFLRGEKSSPDHPFNAHVGRWAARHGMLGAVINYRLAPEATWPAGGEDVGLALDWLRDHAAAHGGDPTRLIAVGTSAGAVHVATMLRLRGGTSAGLRGTVLLSGLYGFTPLEERDTLYYGAQASYAERAPTETVIETTTPLLLVGAELDPPRFQTELANLLTARLAWHDRLPPAMVVGGHNHFSLAYHLGGSDMRLSRAILDFIGTHCSGLPG